MAGQFPRPWHGRSDTCRLLLAQNHNSQLVPGHPGSGDKPQDFLLDAETETVALTPHPLIWHVKQEYPAPVVLAKECFCLSSGRRGFIPCSVLDCACQLGASFNVWPLPGLPGWFPQGSPINSIRIIFLLSLLWSGSGHAAHPGATPFVLPTSLSSSTG